jgi:hypothetical protein
MALFPVGVECLIDNIPGEKLLGKCDKFNAGWTVHIQSLPGAQINRR